jgi:putative two-component system response regulator
MIAQDIIKQARILVIDDERTNIRLLEVILEDAGYTNVHSALDAREALCDFDQIRPDLILLDLSMPRMDGFAFMQELHGTIAVGTVPILVLTADATIASKHKALKAGAKDYLSKPFDQVEVLIRIENLLEFHFHSLLLEAKVQERTQDLESSRLETLQRLARAAEYRDDDTGLHTKRVGANSALIAHAMGLPLMQVELLRLAAPLHDVGKIGISDVILLKPGKLTDEEFDTMRRHAAIGAEILSGSNSPLLQMAEEIALSHHERWDGRGYPHKLAGEAIPLTARIVAVADVFDALTHERPYKKAWLPAAAAEEIQAQCGAQFDSQVVAAFMTLNHEDLL